MLSTILSALLPVTITLLLGYIAGRRHDFTAEHAEVLNRLVLRYALPADLFVGMVTTDRSDLFASGPLIATITVSILASFGLTFVLAQRFRHVDPGTAALYGLAVAAPSVAFVGNSVLGYLYGEQGSAIPISIATLVINLGLVPICLVLLNAQPVVGGGAHRLDRHALVTGIGKAVEQPMIWAPIVGLVIALIGVRFPESIDRGLGLLGAATSGVSIFAAGVILFAQRVTWSRTIGGLTLARNLAVPGAAYLAIRVLGADSKALQEAVLALAIPVASLVVILAVRYKTAQQEMASVLLYSTVGSLVTLPLFIWLME